MLFEILKCFRGNAVTLKLAACDAQAPPEKKDGGWVNGICVFFIFSRPKRCSCGRRPLRGS